MRLTVPATESENDDDHPWSQHSESEDESSKEELNALKEKNQALHGQVSRFESKLEDEKTRFCELLWRINCQCLAEYDVMIAAKDSEIEKLKR